MRQLPLQPRLLQLRLLQMRLLQMRLLRRLLLLHLLRIHRRQVSPPLRLRLLPPQPQHPRRNHLQPPGALPLMPALKSRMSQEPVAVGL